MIFSLVSVFRLFLVVFLVYVEMFKGVSLLDKMRFLLILFMWLFKLRMLKIFLELMFFNKSL